jgi:carbon monoxide dehydrogenase subunit G
MDLTGEYKIAAPREAVWRALNDPEILKQCIPGCESVEKTSDTAFAAKVRAKVGPVSAAFAGKVTLSDLDPPNGYKISGEGTGGVAGFAKGGAEVKLTPDGDGTLLAYTVQASVGGKLAQIGSRLIDSTARAMADQFFAKFAEVVGGGAAVPPAAPAPATEPGGLRPRVWIALLIAIVLLLLICFGVFAA